MNHSPSGSGSRQRTISRKFLCLNMEIKFEKSLVESELNALLKELKAKNIEDVPSNRTILRRCKNIISDIKYWIGRLERESSSETTRDATKN